MIQSTLFFLLGFLSAGLLALLVAPALWRRAVRLTRRRIEASVPLTLDEVQAEKDRLRAEFAMTQRRLEINAKEFSDKATARMIEVDRGREELKSLQSQSDEKSRSIAVLEARAAELDYELGLREEALRRLTQRLGEADLSLDERGKELEKLGRLYDEASFSSSNRQIEVAAREAEIERLATDFSALKSQHKDVERRVQEAAADARKAHDMVRNEKQRVAELEEKAERLVAALADRDARLDRRDKELAELRGKSNGDRETDLGVKLTEALADKVRLESEIAALRLQLSALGAGRMAIGKEAAPAADYERREARLVTLTRENKKLREDLAALALRPSHSKDSDQGDEDAVLREQMHQLAAEVVNLTAALDGPGSPIAKALAAKPRSSAGEGGMISLADRVKALKKAASAD